MLKQLLSKLVLPNLEQVRCNVCYLYRRSFSFFRCLLLHHRRIFSHCGLSLGGFCYSLLLLLLLLNVRLTKRVESSLHTIIPLHNITYTSFSALLRLCLPPPPFSSTPLVYPLLRFFVSLSSFFSLLYIILQYIIHTTHQDLSRTVGREVAKMDSTMSCFAPSVYGYRPKVPTGLSGAFGSTTSPMQQHTRVLSKVDIPFKPNMGLFHE